MKLRINLNLLLITAIVIIILVGAYLLYPRSSQATQQQLPISVRYAIEYFNAQNVNSTLLVPSEYFSQAESLAINGNSVIENDTAYANMVLKNVSLKNVNAVLIDMNVLNYIQLLESYVGVNANYTVTIFPTNYTRVNISNNWRNCQLYKGTVDGFAECVFVVNGTAIGTIGLVQFPNSTSFGVVNASIFYDVSTGSYVPSYVSKNSTGFMPGIMFVYQGVSTFYVPAGLMATFYGKEMFLPANVLRNFFDGYGEARVIRV